MDLDHWYRCTQCGYMYTPQQIQALRQLVEAREESEPGSSSSVSADLPCRKRGCHGRLVVTAEVHRDARI
jgi:rubredoxin